MGGGGRQGRSLNTARQARGLPPSVLDLLSSTHSRDTGRIPPGLRATATGPLPPKCSPAFDAAKKNRAHIYFCLHSDMDM